MWGIPQSIAFSVRSVLKSTLNIEYIPSNVGVSIWHCSRNHKAGNLNTRTRRRFKDKGDWTDCLISESKRCDANLVEGVIVAEAQLERGSRLSVVRGRVGQSGRLVTVQFGQGGGGAQWWGGTYRAEMLVTPAIRSNLGLDMQREGIPP